MATVNIDVSGDPPNGDYSSNDHKVEANGDFSMGRGIHQVHWHSRAGWRFVEPWISISGGAFDDIRGNQNKVSLRDKNESSADQGGFKYTLHTDHDQGDFDPTLTNEGGPGG